MAVGFFPEHVNETDMLAWWEYDSERRRTGAYRLSHGDDSRDDSRWEKMRSEQERCLSTKAKGGNGDEDDDDADNEENSFFMKRKTEEKGERGV